MLKFQSDRPDIKGVQASVIGGDPSSTTEILTIDKGTENGIAVGMATNIPPHNLNEIADAIAAVIDDPKVDDDALCAIVQGPDFPTGGTVMGHEAIKEAYKTGRGSIIMRARHEVEEGRSDSLGEGYPRELSGVASNLNALLIGERRRVARYRDTLGNLAHSLKTPLAVMRSTLAAENPGAEGPVTTEIDRMSGIIEHQLKRAAASTGALLGQAPVDVAPIAALPAVGRIVCACRLPRRISPGCRRVQSDAR